MVVDVEQIEGELSKLQDTLKEKYNHTVAEVKQEINEFVKRFED